jgi:hypothetical protein
MNAPDAHTLLKTQPLQPTEMSMDTQTLELVAPEAAPLRPAAALVAQPQTALATTPADLLRLAVQGGADLDRLERLMALQERWEQAEAKKAFVRAMAAFKSEPLQIFKRKEVAFNDVAYKHAELSDVAGVVVPALARHGLSHRWDVKQSDGRVVVTCVVTHRDGHSESVTIDAAPDNSGKKNAIQQVASAITYCQRYTLLAITGLATQSEEDDDGRKSGETDIGDLLADLYAITDEQAALQFWHKKREGLRDDKPAYERFRECVASHRKNIIAVSVK